LPVELVTGSGHGPLPGLAAIAHRARPESVRRTTNERLTAIIMFIIRAGFEAHCRNWNRGGKPFLGGSAPFFGPLASSPPLVLAKSRLGKVVRPT
jgi:hypothetical protein